MRCRALILAISLTLAPCVSDRAEAELLPYQATIELTVSSGLTLTRSGLPRLNQDGIVGTVPDVRAPQSGRSPAAGFTLPVFA